MISPLMLFEDVPLVSTAKLGSFFESSLIAHHYGDLTRSRVRCVKIEDQLFLVGAHTWQEITACYVAGKRTEGFEPLARSDADGVTRQYVLLASPPSEEASLVEVSGKGKMSSVSGKLLENPDEVIEDIASLCGRVLNFPLFREQCNLRSLRIAGSVDEAKSLRSYVNDIIESVGAKWLGTSAVFYPAQALGYARPVDTSAACSHEVSIDDVAGVLSVFYAWNHAEGRHGAYIEVTAEGCQYNNKGIIYAKWLRLARDAEELARRVLAKRAGSFVKTTATADGVVRAGEVVAIESRTFSGDMLVLHAEPDEVSTQIKGELVLSLHPHISVTKFSSESNSERSERLDILLDLVAHLASITVFDTQNHPIVDIFVTYDGAITLKTNQQGVVVFSVTSGNHTLVLSGPGIDNNDPFPLFIP